MSNDKNNRQGLPLGTRAKGAVVMLGGVTLYYIGRVADMYINLGDILLILYLLAFALFMGGLACVIGGDTPALSAEDIGLGSNKRSKKREREKYNDYQYTCPMCGSHKIKNIGTGKKLAGVAAVGLASRNIGKNYQCDDCNYRW